MKVGDYVRTKGGNIFKIIGGNTDNWEVDISCIQLEQTEENWYESNRYNDNGYWFNKENIIKSSTNIINLIEVGDVIEYRIDNVPLETKGYLKGITDITDEEMINEIKKDKNYHIKSIVTKEMFSSVEYRVETN